MNRCPRVLETKGAIIEVEEGRQRNVQWLSWVVLRPTERLEILVTTSNAVHANLKDARRLGDELMREAHLRVEVVKDSHQVSVAAVAGLRAATVELPPDDGSLEEELPYLLLAEAALLLERKGDLLDGHR